MTDNAKRCARGAEEIDQMKVFYEQGASLSEVGDRFGLTASGVEQLFRRHLIKTRKRTPSSKFRAAMGTRRLRLEQSTLADLYSAQKLSMQKIAVRLNVSPETVHRNLREYGIPIRHLKNYGRSPLSAKLLATLFNDENRTAAEIAERLGCSESTIRRKLAEFKIKKGEQMLDSGSRPTADLTAPRKSSPAGCPVTAEADAPSISSITSSITSSIAFTVAEIAEKYQTERNTVRRLIRDGIFPNAFWEIVGRLRRWRVPAVDLEDFVVPPKWGHRSANPGAVAIRSRCGYVRKKLSLSHGYGKSEFSEMRRLEKAGWRRAEIAVRFRLDEKTVNDLLNPSALRKPPRVTVPRLKKTPERLPEQLLIDLYVDQKLSVAAITERLKTNPSALYASLTHYGIPRRDQRRQNAMREKETLLVRWLVVDKLPIAVIAERLNLTPAYVARKINELKRLGRIPESSD